jgi:hypothetical protein
MVQKRGPREREKEKEEKEIFSLSLLSLPVLFGKFTRKRIKQERPEKPARKGSEACITSPKLA